MDDNTNLIQTDENGGEALREPETNGQWLYRVLKPGGCVVVVVLAVFMILFCLTKKPSLLKDYTPLCTADEYISNPAVLASELRERVFPILPGEESCSETDGGLIIGLHHNEFLSSRAEILNHFPGSIITFEDIG